MTFGAFLRILTFGFTFAWACNKPAYSATPRTLDDANVFTYYNFVPGGSSINWTTCGRTGGISGCFGSGSIGPFAGPCAIMEGKPTTSGNTLNQYVYVVEASTTGFQYAVLDIYQKQDVINGSDTPSMSLVRRINLNLKVGLKTACFMAGGPRYIFIGTVLSARAMRFDTVTQKLVAEGSNSVPTGLVSQITADARGFVTINYTHGMTTAVDFYDPDGNLTQSGGGSAFEPNSSTGVQLR